ncbi:SGNH/GDSL hydrolase family protein [Ramlibacter sp.]|uniref:SGNH/GDSL hydrolase family protein n=1 Tax=Ramlibacter sp. TaxID=1917967 RepID=UPI003D0B1B95
MTGIWLRRSLLLAASAAALALAACGSGTIESQLQPTRLIAFGDGFADVGQGGGRYTINDNTLNVWTLQMASQYGRELTPSSTGGLSYATGNARIAAKPDAAGVSATPTVTEQIDRFLAANTLVQNDLVVVNAGVSDIIVEVAAALAGTQTSAQAVANVRTAARAMATQVRRLVTAGGRHIVVVGPYNMGRSPWAIQTSQQSLLTDAASRFNEELLVNIADLGANVLYIDAALHFNLVVASPSLYSLTNATDVVCTSVDAGAGIGTGAGQVNSRLCTPSTLLAGVDTARYLWADRVYPSPQAHRTFGDYAHARIRERW